ncbi:MAG: O-antigen ligase family protein [Candidatus Margulisbacteria bacterium]|jgi:putative inorganic carbon (HCO3(-)) transporter|nr:O-antigen ligase family protein [Candidatus Margulisiibacteriota bacterium]
MEKLKRFIANYFEDALSPASNVSQRFFMLLNLLLPVFTGLYLFINTLPLTAVSEILFYLSLGILLFLILLKKTDFTLRGPLTIPFAMFLIWSIIGLFFTLDPKNSIHDIYAHLLQYLIIFYLLVNYFHTRKRLEMLSWIMILSIAFFSIGAIIGYYFIDGYPFSARLGIGFRVMYTGTMVIITVAFIPLMLNKLYQSKTRAVKLFLIFCALITTLATLLSQSRAALIGLITALLIMSVNKKKTIVFIIIALFFATAIPSIRDRVSRLGFQDVRSNINRLFFEVFKDYPVTGVGFGIQIYGNPNLIDLKKYNQKLPEEYQLSPNWIFNCPHNAYLDIAVRTGIVGLMLFLSILLVALLMLWQIWRKSQDSRWRAWAVCLLACLVSIIVQIPFNDLYYPSWISLYTILAMITIVWGLAGKNQAVNQETRSTS